MGSLQKCASGYISDSQNTCIHIHRHFFSETRIGVDVQSLTVSEEVEGGQVEVCVAVFIPVLPCPIAFPFEINVRTKPNTASEASNALV